ncbi:unnamed protein product [Blepharisma stoltei]|uniref:Calcium-dependent protein kinase 1 n=1 Tax=Blepharisma stoltei TaxID=1481888 RepID=A0AAU9INW5_9CILI|nr:unnamed protein product [Blepharisma stoltei]
MGCVASKKETNSQALRISTVTEIKVQPSSFIVENEHRFQDVYKLGKKIGSGAFGDVKLCSHLITGAERAVKIFRKDLAVEPDKQRILINELDTLKILDHPNIIRIYEFFEDSMRFYIVMENCKGGELFVEIIKRQNFNELQAAQIMCQLFSAVLYLHENGIVHRDIKPENILLEEEGDISNIKLIDFGSSTRFIKGQLIKGTLGTTYYISPEVLSGTYNEKCDMWSCGVILYILLCGHPPFDGKNDEEIIECVKRGKFTFKGEIWRSVSNAAKNMISELLCLASMRLSASQALSHPWMTRNASLSSPDPELIQSALMSLQQFHASSKLKDAINAFITTQCISLKDTKMLRNIFQAIDTNHDGKLSREELMAQFMKIMGDEAADEEVKRIMAEVDTDHNGFIDYSEFLKAAMDRKILESSENMKLAFDAFDKDGNQSISALEVKRMLEGKASSEDKVWATIIGEVDENNDGEIDFNEFQKIVLSHV